MSVDLEALKRLEDQAGGPFFSRDELVDWAREVASTLPAIIAALERAERVEAAAMTLDGQLERTLEGRRYCQWCGSDQAEQDARALGHFLGCEAAALRAALAAAPEGSDG